MTLGRDYTVVEPGIVCREGESVQVFLSFLVETKIILHCNINIFHAENHIVHYTRCITPMRVTSFQCSSPRHSDNAVQLTTYVDVEVMANRLHTVLELTSLDFNSRPSASKARAHGHQSSSTFNYTI